MDKDDPVEKTCCSKCSSPQRDIEYGRLVLAIGSDGDDGGGENTRHEVETQNDPLCHPGPEVRVRLQAVNLSGNPVTQVEVVCRRVIRGINRRNRWKTSC